MTRLFLMIAVATATFVARTAHADAVSDNPILFVTMVPNPRDFGTLAATFANHIANPDTAYRGGDLWIRYSDGTLKNITNAAGYGNAGFQGASSIAVRDPAVHWNGQKAIFSMVVGAATARYQVGTYRWQLYEVTGLGPTDTPVITKVPHQPNYNNHSPAYASDDSIIFISDRPRDDSVLHTYPQRDEYESSPVNSGLWKLSTSGAITLLDHAPSGDFNPIVDSYGRIIFTRWDHLQRDQQNVGASLGAFNYSSETSTTPLSSAAEVFPEPRSALDPAYQPTTNLFTINQFFPWMMNQDGTDLETLNHIGRQEIGLYSERSFNTDPNVQEFYGQYTTGANQNEFTIFLHIKERPTTRGLYLGTSCQEFGTHSAGQILSITGAPGVNPDAMVVTYLTHPDTAGASDTPSGNHSGLYRDPLPLTNGKTLVSHTANTRQDSNIGSSSAPLSRYDFRLKLLTSSGSYYVADSPITSGISKSVTFWSPDESVSYNGLLWEMMPVEVVARTRPTAPQAELPSVEAGVLSELGIDLEVLRDYLRSQNLALVVSRNLTMRDRNDRQQPSNLRVTGTTTQSLPHAGKIYDVSQVQFFQGDLIRGYTGSSGSGRRVIAQPMHSVASGINPVNAGLAEGSVPVAEDGSMAAFVPAGRALTWQLSDSDATPVVRERYWVTFQPGEVRVCASCHGINTADHTGKQSPTNTPLALTRLLTQWKTGVPPTAPYTLSIPKAQKKSKGAFTISAGGGVGSTELLLRASLNGRACNRTKQFATGSTSRTLRGRFPNMSGARVLFQLTTTSSSTALASASKKLAGRSHRASTRELKAHCSSLFKSLR